MDARRDIRRFYHYGRCPALVTEFRFSRHRGISNDGPRESVLAGVVRDRALTADRTEAPRPVEWFLIGLAFQTNYISVYVSAVEGREYVAEKYGEEIGKVKVGKSSISFRSLDDIDLDKLLAIVAKHER